MEWQPQSAGSQPQGEVSRSRSCGSLEFARSQFDYEIRCGSGFSTYEIDYREKPVLLIPPIINEEITAIRRFLKQWTIQADRLTKNATPFFNQLLTVIEESGGTVDARHRKLTHLFEQNQLAINAREIQPMLKDVLSANHIQLNVPVQNWEEAIERSAQPLVKEQIIEKRYIEAMVAAVEEYGPYIVIGNIWRWRMHDQKMAPSSWVSVSPWRRQSHLGTQKWTPKIIFAWLRWTPTLILPSWRNWSNWSMMKKSHAVVGLLYDWSVSIIAIFIKTRKEEKSWTNYRSYSYAVQVLAAACGSDVNRRCLNEIRSGGEIGSCRYLISGINETRHHHYGREFPNAFEKFALDPTTAIIYLRNIVSKPEIEEKSSQY